MSDGRWVGTSLKRKEDPTLLTGRGSYIDDLTLPGMLHAAMLRSPHAHARIKGIDVSAALQVPGVVAILTGKDVAKRALPFMSAIGGPTMEFCLAVGKVRHVGEPVAAVVATDRYTAEDARDLIRVDYEPLPAVVDVEEAIAPGAPLIYEIVGSNILWQKTIAWGDPEGAFRKADLIVRDKFYFHRYSATPVETCGVVASYDPAKGSLTIWDNNHLMMAAPFVSMVLKLPPEKVRFIRHDIGGSYGNKTQLHNYEVLI
ncbi:MAG TPA: molybdopterin cofactor-binding domain-containing protein, partial [Dehalococcoidia bacterium]|nr:molybdopterin cofactor-binding domain-containing protein [Dehalococcoidia bacterium]